MRETDIVQQCRLEAHKYGLTLFRNNSGKLEDKNGRWVSFGVGQPGGSDLIGWHNGTGRFVAFEVKMPGKKAKPEQRNFIAQVIAAGGIAGVIYSPEDMKSLVDAML
jgi:hypothetical protein